MAATCKWLQVATKWKIKMRTSCELNDTFRLSDVLSTPKPPVASVFLKNTQTAYWSLCENIKPHVVVSLPPSNPFQSLPKGSSGRCLASSKMRNRGNAEASPEWQSRSQSYAESALDGRCSFVEGLFGGTHGRWYLFGSAAGDQLPEW